MQQYYVQLNYFQYTKLSSNYTYPCFDYYYKISIMYVKLTDPQGQFTASPSRSPTCYQQQRSENKDRSESWKTS
jgi:hypothetical protein